MHKDAEPADPEVIDSLAVLLSDLDDPAFPEKDQPRLCGWVHRLRIGAFTLGGKGLDVCVLADLHYRLSAWPDCGPARYPFCSVDYCHEDHRITGLALLVRRPFLDLGVIPEPSEESSRART